ncbi:hypothetical protein [Psychrobacillus sp. FSL H8-0487]|uniref:hypothetical protein n=1 Tax=Psychrobacillus sp. FSL H8-0487 TaxID=2921391 RepID=UPI0030FC9564
MEANVARKATNVARNDLEVAQPLPNVANRKKINPNEVNVAATTTNVARNDLEVAQPPTNVAHPKNVAPNEVMLRERPPMLRITN